MLEDLNAMDLRHSKERAVLDARHKKEREETESVHNARRELLQAALAAAEPYMNNGFFTHEALIAMEKVLVNAK
jgi:hypothetical protein